MSRRFISLLVLLVIVSLFTLATFAVAFELPKWFPFSVERSLNEWEDKIFRGRVIYEIETNGPLDYLHALSRSTASAIFYKIRQRFRAQEYPMFSWKWKVTKFPDQEKLKGRQGIERDDYAARVYVIFPSMFILNSKVLEYVWDEVAPLESISSSPYSANIKLIVAHTGNKDIGKWVFEERNIIADYRKAFGRDPSLKVGAIALMSDSDTIGDTSEAYFDDIKMGYIKER
ncbi:MAG: DUF3047 domain-containing protein [Candidatus Omnitrophota bacterium]